MKKKLLGLSTLALVAAPLATTIACGSDSKSTSKWATSKEIVISVDGAQTVFYNNVKAQFDKTDAHTKDGYNIRFVEKDVWGALDLVGTVGYTDDNVGDFIYMPQDRLTGMLQSKALMPWSEDRSTAWLTTVGATADEKKEAAKFGSYTYQNKATFFAAAHNKEGMALVSSLDQAVMTAEAESKSMFKLMSEAKGWIRLQDFWYGNGIFGNLEDVNGEDLVKQFLYKDGSTWKTIFDKDHANHAEVTPALKAMAEMWLQPLLAAKTFQSEGDGTHDSMTGQAWYDKMVANKVDASDVVALYQQDMGVVHNKLIEMMNKDSIQYMLIGTWDAQKLAAEGHTSFYNPQTFVSKTDGITGVASDIPFTQASGTWSYGINARNNGASASRIDALYEVLDIIYSDEASYEYFDNDTKIPWFKDIQNSVGDIASENQLSEYTPLVEIMEDWNDGILKPEWGITKDGAGEITAVGDILSVIDDAKLVQVDQIGAFDNLRGAKGQEKNFGTGWEIHGDNSDFDNTQNAADLYKTFTDSDEFTSIADAPGDLAFKGLFSTEFSKFLTSEVSADRNSIGYVMGLGNLNWHGTGDSAGQPWQIERALLKTEDGLDGAEEGSTHWHLRKVENIVFGWNGGSGETWNTYLADTIKVDTDVSKVATPAEMKTWLTSAYKTFNDFKVTKTETLKAMNAKYAKTPETTFDGDLANAAMVRKFNSSMYDVLYSFFEGSILGSMPFISKGGAEIEGVSLSDFQTALSDAMAGQTFGTVFSLITTNTLGTFTTQVNRLDRGNPQFGSFWSEWNDQTFGSATLLIAEVEKLVGKTTASDDFYTLIEDRLHTRLTTKAEALDAANAAGAVVID